jgi:hypothetical protein
MLLEYLAEITQTIDDLSNVYVERYEEEIFSNKRANLRIRLRFNQTYLLEINEAIIVNNNQLEFLDYRYHLQDQNNLLIFRYDSTPHFPQLANFPHHKHLPDQVIPSEKPAINQVLREVELFILSKPCLSNTDHL